MRSVNSLSQTADQRDLSLAVTIPLPAVFNCRHLCKQIHLIVVSWCCHYIKKKVYFFLMHTISLLSLYINKTTHIKTNNNKNYVPCTFIFMSNDAIWMKQTGLVLKGTSKAVFLWMKTVQVPGSFGQESTYQNALIGECHQSGICHWNENTSTGSFVSFDFV